MNRTTVMTAPGVLAVCALLLSGCVTVQVQPQATPDPVVTREATRTDEPRNDATGVPGADCSGEPVTLDGSSTSYTLIGECPSVTIEGTDLDIRLVDAEIGAIVLRGDRIEIDAVTIGSVEISGADNSLEATTIGALMIRGDRNEIDVDGRLEAVTINGNENEVDAAVLGDVVDNGDRNVFEQD